MRDVERTSRIRRDGKRTAPEHTAGPEQHAQFGAQLLTLACTRAKGYLMAKRERKMLAKPKHPNIVNLVESFHPPSDAQLVIILEYCACECP